MSESAVQEGEAAWRRRLGSAANNRGWSLSEKSTRTPEEDQEMLHAAHASAHLWSTVGNEHNLALGRLLLGQAHALLGNSRYAMSYAEAAHTYFTSRACEPWELAISHAVLANAAHCIGNRGLHEASYQTAAALISKLESQEDRKILAATLNVVPTPEGSGRVGVA